MADLSNFRGYLASTGSNNYNGANLLNYVGNDVNGQGTTGINVGKVQNDASLYGKTNLNDIQNQVNNLYGQYQKAYYSAAGGGGGSSASAASNAAAAAAARERANTAAYYNDQINTLNGQAGRLDAQQNVGMDNINNSYNTSLNRLNQQNATAEQNYNSQTQDNVGNYAKNRSAIISKTNNQASAVQRLLGMAGAGNSSAAYEQAPYAAGLQGTQQLGDAQTTYATNARNLDTANKTRKTAYQNNLDDLNNQKYVQSNNLRSSIASTRAGLLDQIRSANIQRDLSNGSSYATAAARQAGMAGQVNNLLNSITELGRQYAAPVIQTGNLDTSVPTLGQYSLGRSAAPAVQGGESSVDSTFAPLLYQQRDQFGNIIR